jgi:autotransporter-associated beta strand protein
LQYNGGSNTTFDVEGSVYTRNGNFIAGEGIVLGALTGAGSVSGGGASGSVGTTYLIGSANKSTTFTGTITDGGAGNTALIKVGTGSLTLTQPLVYSGNTTINGGSLVLGTGVDPTNSATLSLGSGTLDVASLGDGTITLGAARNQTLSGTGSIIGSLVAQANTVFNPALGTVTVTGGSVSLGGTNNFVLNRTNLANCSELVSTNITASGVLTVVNNGPALQSGDTFHLFSTGVSGFSSVTLPTLTSPYYWSNTIASNGAITVAGTATPPVSYIAFKGAPVISGTSLSISVTNSGGGNLYLLTTTNLANAVSTWSPIWTNTVSGTGNFTTNLANAVNPAYSQQFFLMSTNN